MSDEINIRITMNAYDKLKIIKKWYDLEHSTNASKKYIIEYVFDKFIYDTMIPNDLPDTPKIINSTGDGYRFDSKYELITKDMVDKIKKHKKFKNMNQLINSMAKCYIDNNPDMKEVRKRSREIYLDGV